MSVIDASAWISYLIWEDEHHRETVAWMDTLASSRQSQDGPSLLLLEVAGAVARRMGRAEAALRLVERLRSTSVLRLHPFDESQLATHIELAAQLRLRAADVLYIALARQLDVPLITWDRQQRDRALGHITVMTPAEALAAGR